MHVPECMCIFTCMYTSRFVFAYMYLEACYTLSVKISIISKQSTQYDSHMYCALNIECVCGACVLLCFDFASIRLRLRLFHASTRITMIWELLWSVRLCILTNTRRHDSDFKTEACTHVRAHTHTHTHTHAHAHQHSYIHTRTHTVDFDRSTGLSP